MTGAVKILLTLLVCYAIAACGQITSPNARRQLPTTTSQRNDSNLVFACGSKGMGVDFATGNCVSQSGNQVSPFNLYPPFQAPLQKPSNEELIVRCQGRAVDFVTGRCM